VVALSPDPGRQDRNPTPFLRAFALTGGGVIFVVVVLALTVSGADRAAYLAGRYSAGFIFGGIAVGVWARLARRRWGWPSYVWRFALISFAFTLFGLIGAAAETIASRVVTAAEKQGLAIGPDSIRHPTFGFAFPNPGPGFTRDSALQQRLNAVLKEQPGVFGWVLRDTLHPQVVLVMVAKFSDVEGRHFGEFVKGMRSTAGTSANLVMLEDSLFGTGAGSEYRMAAQVSNGMFMHIRCRISGQGRNRTAIVCLQTSSAERDGLEWVRRGLTVRPVERS